LKVPKAPQSLKVFFFSNCPPSILDETNLNRAKSQADAEYYTTIKQAEAEQKKLTPQFLQFQWAQSISNNTKIYFGPSINSMMTDFTEAFKHFLNEKKLN